MEKLTLIGPGRLGLSLTGLWLQSGQIQLEAVVASSAQKANTAVSKLERDLGWSLSTKKQDAKGQVVSRGLILIATPDDQLLGCARQLMEEADLSACRQIFFCSGSIESQAVAEALRHSVPVVGVHPMMSFTKRLIAPNEFEDVVCTFEGIQAESDLVVDLFRAIGGRVVPIGAQSKLRYHLGTVVACNYINALRIMAEGHLVAAGMDSEDIHAGLSRLMTQTISNVNSSGAIKALTGPVTRGDVGLIERQLELLESDEQDYQVYVGLAKVLLDKLDLDRGLTQESSRLRVLLNSKLLRNR